MRVRTSIGWSFATAVLALLCAGANCHPTEESPDGGDGGGDPCLDAGAGCDAGDSGVHPDGGSCAANGLPCSSPSECCSQQCDPLGRCFSRYPETGECQSSTECLVGQMCSFPDDSGVGQCLPGCRQVSQACKPGVVDCCGNNLCVDLDGSTCPTAGSGCLCVYPR